MAGREARSSTQKSIHPLKKAVDKDYQELLATRQEFKCSDKAASTHWRFSCLASPCAHTATHTSTTHALYGTARTLAHSHVLLVIARQHSATSAALVQFPVKNKLSLPLLAAAAELAPPRSLRCYRRAGRSWYIPPPGQEIMLRKAIPSISKLSLSSHPSYSGQLQDEGREENSSYRT